MDSKFYSRAVAQSMIIVMIVTAIFVPNILNAEKTYGEEKQAFYNKVPTVSIPSKITAKKAFSVTVYGDNVSTTSGAVEGTLAYVPTRVQFKKGSMAEKTYNIPAATSRKISNIKLTRMGAYTVNTTYQVKELSGGQWINKRTHTEIKSINVWGTVTFNKNKGKFKKGSIKKKVVLNGKKYGKMATLKKRSGYKFMGWYTSKTGGKKVTKKTKVNLYSDTTLYAQWKYSVKFNANKGKVSKKSKKVTSGKKYGKLPKPKRSGYDFLGWYTKKSGGTKVTSTTYVTKAKKHTIYAQ